MSFMRSVDDLFLKILSHLYEFLLQFIFIKTNDIVFYFYLLEQYSFTNLSFVDVLNDINEIYTLSQYDDIANIDYKIHQCVMFERIPFEDGLFYDILILGEKKIQALLSNDIKSSKNTNTKYIIVQKIVVATKEQYKKKFLFKLILIFN